MYAASFGAKVNALDNEGKTPLILTSKGYEEHRNLECLKKLLLAGADKTIADKAGKRAIDYLHDLVPEDGQTDRYLLDSIKILNEKWSLLVCMAIKGSYAK